MTQQQPSQKKPPPDAAIFFGGISIAVGGMLGYLGISNLCAAVASGVAGFSMAVAGAGHVLLAGAGLYVLVKGAISMGRGFTRAGRTKAEIALEEEPETFILQNITTPQKTFNPRAARDVKIMRPLKLNPKNGPQPRA